MPDITQNNNSGQFFLELTIAIGELLFFFLLKLPYFYLESLYRLFNKPPAKSVKGETVLITGAGHGIGRELALLYASEGATVVAWDINMKNNENTVKEIQKLRYPKAHAYQCDVSKRDEVFAVAKKVLQEVGDITIIINNAGIMPTHSFLDHTLQELDNIININVMAHFWILKSFLPIMKKNNRGHIVSISSLAGIAGARNLVPYCASKFAVFGYMQALEREFNHMANNEIKFTTICPFMVDTGLCKRPVNRFPSLTKLLTVNEVAQKVLDGQKNGKSVVMIPAAYEGLSKVARLWPQRAAEEFLRVFESNVESDL